MQEKQTPSDQPVGTIMLVIRLVWIEFALKLIAIGPLRKVRTLGNYRGELGQVWTALFSALYCIRASAISVVCLALMLVSPIWLPPYVWVLIRRKKARINQINAEVASD